VTIVLAFEGHGIGKLLLPLALIDRRQARFRKCRSARSRRDHPRFAAIRNRTADATLAPALGATDAEVAAPMPGDELVPRSSAEVAVHRRVARLRLLGRALGKAEMPGGVLPQECVFRNAFCSRARGV
jgi:hypothetical protein